MMEDTFVHFASGMTPIEREVEGYKLRKKAYIKRNGRKAWNNYLEILEAAKKLKYSKEK